MIKFIFPSVYLFYIQTSLFRVESNLLCLVTIRENYISIGRFCLLVRFASIITAIAIILVAAQKLTFPQLLLNLVYLQGTVFTSVIFSIFLSEMLSLCLPENGVIFSCLLLFM